MHPAMEYLEDPNNVVQEFEVQQTFDEDIYLGLDRVIVTKAYTFALFHFKNEFFDELTHGVRVNGPGSDHAYQIKDVASGKTYNLVHAYNVATEEDVFTPVRLGELQRMVLVFEKTPENLNNIEIISGTPVPFEENERKTITLDDHFSVRVQLQEIK